MNLQPPDDCRLEVLRNNAYHCYVMCPVGQARLNKRYGSKIRIDSQVRQETPEERQRKYGPKRCGYNFTLDTYLIILSVNQGGIKYHFLKLFGMTRPGIEPMSPGPLGNTLSTRPMSRYSLLVTVICYSFY